MIYYDLYEHLLFLIGFMRFWKISSNRLAGCS